MAPKQEAIAQEEEEKVFHCNFQRKDCESKKICFLQEEDCLPKLWSLNRKHGKLGIFLLVVPRSYTFDGGEELQFMGEGERELSKE